jgi:hypothetical protein
MRQRIERGPRHLGERVGIQGRSGAEEWVEHGQVLLFLFAQPWLGTYHEHPDKKRNICLTTADAPLPSAKIARRCRLTARRIVLGSGAQRRAADLLEEKITVIRVTAFRWVPPFAQGLVRDLRVRWALEEAGLPYDARLLGPEEQGSASYRRL